MKPYVFYDVVKFPVLNQLRKMKVFFINNRLSDGKLVREKRFIAKQFADVMKKPNRNSLNCGKYLKTLIMIYLDLFSLTLVLKYIHCTVFI